MTGRLVWDQLYIGGWARPAGRDVITVTSPVTEHPVGSVPAGTPDDIDRAVAAARTAFDRGPWPRMTVTERAAHLARMGGLYAEGADEAAELITTEMGSPAWFTAQTTHPQLIFTYYLTMARERGNGLFTDHRGGHTVTREPAGVCALITPWNMPHKTILMKAIPALLAGCTLVIKPAAWSPLSALWLADIAHRAGLPAGVVNIVPARPHVSAYLAGHPDIDKIAFTGSTDTGRRIAAAAAPNLTRVSLELGGKSAMVLLDDADLTAAFGQLLGDSLACSGQICSNQTRILVDHRRYREACDTLAALMADLTVGDPADPATEIGPLAAPQQLHRALAAIDRHHTTPVLGGRRAARPGWFLEPTLFTDVRPGSELFRTEVFAPVLAVTPFDGDDQAVELANATPYGLDGAVWSADPARARHVATQLRTGTVRINGAEPSIGAPLGGFKHSGIGRELGPEGLWAFTETKTTVPAAGPRIPHQAGVHRGEPGPW